MKKRFVTEVIDQSFHGKEARNSSDYRKSLLVVCAFFIVPLYLVPMYP